MHRIISIRYACRNSTRKTAEKIMSNRTLPLDDKLYQYLIEHSLRETNLARQLRETTAALEMARMQIAPEQGQFMALLVELTGATRIIEIGTFTGYSTLCMAQALPSSGEVVCCDVSVEWTDIGRRFWEKAGVAERIDLRIAPALDTLGDLIRQGQSGTFDMAFIDADKANYENYYELCMQLLHPGGLILFDNTLWGGAVADESVCDEDTLSLRRINDQLLEDERVSISLVPIGDGLTLARKR